MQVDPVLTPDVPVRNELEVTAVQRMERVSHPNNPPTRLIGCS